jgi:hypothetical protein
MEGAEDWSEGESAKVETEWLGDIGVCGALGESEEAEDGEDGMGSVRAIAGVEAKEIDRGEIGSQGKWRPQEGKKGRVTGRGTAQKGILEEGGLQDGNAIAQQDPKREGRRGFRRGGEDRRRGRVVWRVDSRKSSRESSSSVLIDLREAGERNRQGSRGSMTEWEGWAGEGGEREKKHTPGVILVTARKVGGEDWGREQRDGTWLWLSSGGDHIAGMRVKRGHTLSPWSHPSSRRLNHFTLRLHHVSYLPSNRVIRSPPCPPHNTTPLLGKGNSLALLLYLWFGERYRL